MLRQQAEAAFVGPQVSPLSSPSPNTTSPEAPISVSADEDPELAAYNARLAALAAQGPKTWRKREAVVVRREQ
jgi:hypothetical protein